jgi:hypothetical protein
VSFTMPGVQSTWLNPQRLARVAADTGAYAAVAVGLAVYPLVLALPLAAAATHADSHEWLGREYRVRFVGLAVMESTTLSCALAALLGAAVLMSRGRCAAWMGRIVLLSPLVVLGPALAWMGAYAVMLAAPARWVFDEPVLWRVLRVLGSPWWVLLLLAMWGAGLSWAVYKVRRASAVCIGCGYALRGLPAEAMVCPECGLGFSSRRP